MKAIIEMITKGYIKKGKREGKGIYYYNNGSREVCNYLNDKIII